MSGRGSVSRAARLLCATGCIALSAAPALGQAAPEPPPSTPPGEPELDPNAPLAPMPDLGVEWPQLDVKETAPPPQAAVEASKKPLVDQAEDGTGTVRYTVEVEGLSSVGASEELLSAFRKASTLE